MAERPRLFVVAGEASGDRIGADLVERLAQRGTQPDLSGVGGPELAAAGLTSLFPMADLAVMGWSDVLKRLPLLLWRVRQTASAILRNRPDLVVFIDSQVFVQAVARRVRKAGWQGRMLLYVAPSVWAYKPERAAAIRPLFDEVLAILPHEPSVMARLAGPPTTYVGHPALDRFAFRTLLPQRGPLLLLPGSRDGELRRHLPLMKAAAQGLARHAAVSSLVLPTLPHLVERLRRETASWGVPVEIVTGSDRAPAFASAVAAFAVSGTISLELALSGIPMVVTYVGDQRQARHFARAGNPPIALPSIVMGDRLVPELLFTGAIDMASVVPTLGELLDRPDLRAHQVASFARMRQLMLTGTPDAPRTDPATRVLAHLGQPARLPK